MRNKNPSAYLDTNIFSARTYNGGSAAGLARCNRTVHWWMFEAPHFDLYTSLQTEMELQRGKFKNQSESLAAARRTPFLHVTREVRDCTAIFLETALFPDVEDGDAIHLAVATIYRLDYFLSSNQAHLAKVEVQSKLDRLNAKHGWRSPLLVTPASIPWTTLRQEIRRKK